MSATANAFALLSAGDDAADVDIGALVAAAPVKAVPTPAAPVEEKGESHHPHRDSTSCRAVQWPQHPPSPPQGPPGAALAAAAA